MAGTRLQHALPSLATARPADRIRGASRTVSEAEVSLGAAAARARRDVQALRPRRGPAAGAHLPRGRAGLAPRPRLRRLVRLPGAARRPDRLGVGADRGALDHDLPRAARRSCGRRAPILENTVVQTTGSAGESIAAGVAFTLPALVLLGFEMDWTRTLRALAVRRRPRRADDDPAAALPDREGARRPHLPRGHGVRRGADRRREGRDAGRAHLQGAAGGRLYKLVHGGPAAVERRARDPPAGR